MTPDPSRRREIAEARAAIRLARRTRAGWKMLAAGLLTGFIGGYGLMIIIGILHAWWRTIPTMGIDRAITISDILLITVIAITVVIQTARELT